MTVLIGQRKSRDEVPNGVGDLLTVNKFHFDFAGSKYWKPVVVRGSLSQIIIDEHGKNKKCEENGKLFQRNAIFENDYSNNLIIPFV